MLRVKEPVHSQCHIIGIISWVGGWLTRPPRAWAMVVHPNYT